MNCMMEEEIQNLEDHVIKSKSKKIPTSIKTYLIKDPKTVSKSLISLYISQPLYDLQVKGGARHLENYLDILYQDKVNKKHAANEQGWTDGVLYLNKH